MDANMITLKEKIERSESIIKQLQSSKEEETLKLTTALEEEKERFSSVSSRLQSFVKENETIMKQVRSLWFNYSWFKQQFLKYQPYEMAKIKFDFSVYFMWFKNYEFSSLLYFSMKNISTFKFAFSDILEKETKKYIAPFTLFYEVICLTEHY